MKRKNEVIDQFKSIIAKLESDTWTPFDRDLVKQMIRDAYNSLEEFQVEKLIEFERNTNSAEKIESVEDVISVHPTKDQLSVKTELEERTREEKMGETETIQDHTHQHLIRKVAESTQKLLRQEKEPEMPKEPEKTDVIIDSAVETKLGSTASVTMDKKQFRSCKDYIDLNKKFFFVSELFNGDGTAYDSFIRRLDETSDLKNAGNLLQIMKRDKPQWAKKDHALEVLMGVITKRFELHE